MPGANDDVLDLRHVAPGVGDWQHHDLELHIHDVGYFPRDASDSCPYLPALVIPGGLMSTLTPLTAERNRRSHLGWTARNSWSSGANGEPRKPRGRLYLIRDSARESQP